MRIYTVKENELTHYWGDVTNIFKSYIGNIVKSAKVLLATDYNVSGVNNIKEIAKEEMGNIIKQYNKNGIFHFDSTEVVIYFTNGESIKVCNSEWGYFCKGE